MRLVYSSQRIDGVDGIYKNPIFFNPKDLDGTATEVWTDDEKIAEAYKGKVEVFTLSGKPFFKKTRRTKKETEKGDE